MQVSKTILDDCNEGPRALFEMINDALINDKKITVNLNNDYTYESPFFSISISPPMHYRNYRITFSFWDEKGGDHSVQYTYKSDKDRCFHDYDLTVDMDWLQSLHHIGKNLFTSMNEARQHPCWRRKGINKDIGTEYEYLTADETRAKLYELTDKYYVQKSERCNPKFIEHLSLDGSDDELPPLLEDLYIDDQIIITI